MPIPTSRLFAAVLLALTAVSHMPAQTSNDALPHVLVHRPFDAYYSCGEHREGELPYPGDALGADCVVQKLVEIEGRTWARSHSGDGTENEQWFGWRQEVLAPISGRVAKVQVNETTNEPGMLGQPPATFVVIRSADGVNVLTAHLRELQVAEGETVEAGEVIGRVGNNGFGRTPHVHMGAWKGDQPMQLRFDLKTDQAVKP